MNLLNYSLIFNFILLFCLFALNIVYFIHKRHFDWKNRKVDKTENKKVYIDGEMTCNSDSNFNSITKSGYRT